MDTGKLDTPSIVAKYKGLFQISEAVAHLLLHLQALGNVVANYKVVL